MRAVNTQALAVPVPDTGVGKSIASAALLHALRWQGSRAVGVKPIGSACGCAASTTRA